MLQKLSMNGSGTLRIVYSLGSEYLGPDRRHSVEDLTHRDRVGMGRAERDEGQPEQVQGDGYPEGQLIHNIEVRLFPALNRLDLIGQVLRLEEHVQLAVLRLQNQGLKRSSSGGFQESADSLLFLFRLLRLFGDARVGVAADDQFHKSQLSIADLRLEIPTAGHQGLPSPLGESQTQSKK